MQKKHNLKNLEVLKAIVQSKRIEVKFSELYALIAQINENPKKALENSVWHDISKKLTFEGNFLKTEIFKRSGEMVKIRYRVNIATDYKKFTTLYLLSNGKVFILDGNETMKEGLYLDIDEAIDIYSGDLKTTI